MSAEVYTCQQTERFWFGHLNDKKGGSLVIWDRDGPEPPDGSVYLYVYRRDAIVQFVVDIVQPNLRPADNAEIKYLSSNALESYFQALHQYYKKVREHRAEHSQHQEFLAEGNDYEPEKDYEDVLDEWWNRYGQFHVEKKKRSLKL